MKRKSLKKLLAIILCLVMSVSVIIQNICTVYGADFSKEIVTSNPGNIEKDTFTIDDLYKVTSIKNTLDKNNETYISYSNVGTSVTVEVYSQNVESVEPILDGPDKGKYKFKLAIAYVKNEPPTLNVINPPSDKSFKDYITVDGTVQDPNDGESVKLYYTIDKKIDETNKDLKPQNLLYSKGMDTNTPYSIVAKPTAQNFTGYVPISKVQEGNHTLYIWAEDGINKTPVKVINFTNDKSAPENPIISTTPGSDVYAKKVSVNIAYPSDAVTKKYRTSNDPFYKDYSSSFDVSENQTVYAACYDEVGQQSLVSSLEITNIDNQPPTKPTINVVGPDVVTDNSIHFKVTPGVDEHPNATTYYNYDGNWKPYPEDIITTGIEIPKTKVGETVIKAKTVDQAGNETFADEKKVTIKSTTVSPSPSPSSSSSYVPSGSSYVAPVSVNQSPTSTPTPTVTPTPTSSVVVQPTKVIGKEGVKSDLGVFLTSDKTIYEENNTVSFSVYYINKLATSADNVIVNVEVPQKTTVADNGKGTVNNNILSWNIGNVASKASGEIKFKLKIGQLDKSEVILTSKATISSSNVPVNTDDDQSIFNFMAFSKKLENKPHVKFINGYANNEFKPENMITRAEVAKILVTALNLSKGTSAKKSFKDVDKKHWAYDYINTAVNNGLFDGYTDGTFLPNKFITRAELSTVLVKYLKFKNVDPFKLHFNDISKHWAKNYIEEIYRSKLIEGYKDGSFKPDSQIKRCECVTIIDRLLYRGPLKDVDCGFKDVKKSHWAYGYIAEGSIDHSYIRNADGSETKKVKK
ncbi:MAG: S-layer homology domain-containing protein [Bacillota bacterium]|nr:S-layer homology domain-containing protein [Bacillota bacterium]